MSRLHEYKGKELLSKYKIKTGEHFAVKAPEQAREAALKINKPVAIKAQVFTTGRAGKGLIRFADTGEEVFNEAKEILSMEVDGLPVDTVLIEEKLSIVKEFYGGLIIDDNLRKWSGSHLFDPALIPGILFSNKKITKDSPSIYDITPTILKIIGYTPEELEVLDLDGTPLL